MKTYKEEIVQKHGYTELVYQRINKKLHTNFSRKEIEAFIEKTLKETDVEFYEKIGKNFYITNKKNKLKITINANSFRVITVDKVNKNE